MIRRKEERER
jgi:hypothetical protein